jgi:hypothetical protein
MHSRLLVGFCCAAMTLLFQFSARGALLEGATMSVVITHIPNIFDPVDLIDSGEFVVGPGVELINFGANDFPPRPGFMNIDISDTQILITASIDQPLAYEDILTFKDQSDTIPFITSISVDPSTDWAGFTPSLVTGGGDFFINVNISELTALQGQKILLNLTPEPAAALLLAVACPALVTAHRRRLGRT